MGTQAEEEEEGLDDEDTGEEEEEEDEEAESDTRKLDIGLHHHLRFPPASLSPPLDPDLDAVGKVQFTFVTRFPQGIKSH